MKRFMILSLALIISCTSIGGKIGAIGGQIGAAAGRRAAIKSQKLALEAQKLALEIEKNLNEIDTTIKYSDELPKQIKDLSENYIQSLYESLDEELVSILNPEKFHTIIDLSLEHTALYDSSYISIDITYPKDSTHGFITVESKRDDFDFSYIEDSLITFYKNNGLLYVQWRFFKEDLYLFLAVKPKIDIYIDNSLEINKYHQILIPLINDVLNFPGRRRPLNPDPLKLIRYDKFEGRINFISADIQKLPKSQSTSQTISLTRSDIYDDSWAVIIGIDKYKYSDQLNYAVKDAAAVKEMLINKFDYPEENIRYLVDEQATQSNIKYNLGEIAISANENDRILVFYSGHGETLIGADKSEKGYIIPFEGKQDNPYATGIAMDEILTTAQLSKSKHMLFLMDACYSGLMTKQYKGLAKPMEQGYLTKVANEQARQIITAGGNEPAVEGGRWDHSVFTKNLLEGLNDWQADNDVDGYITADELGTYLRKSVTEDSNNMQTPQKGRFINSGGGEFVFFSDAKITTPIYNIYEEDQREFIYGCMDEEANNYNPKATKSNMSCQYGKVVSAIEFGDFEWKYPGTDTSYVEVGILINNDENIAGYQFSINGGIVISASGGLSEDNDFIITIEEDLVLSFSPNEGGMFVRGGNQLLINLLIQPEDTYICIHDVFISDVTGHAIPALSSDCFQP